MRYISETSAFVYNSKFTTQDSSKKYTLTKWHDDIL